MSEVPVHLRELAVGAAPDGPRRERQDRPETPPPYPAEREREIELFIDNLLVRIHLIIEKILEDRPCAMGG